MKRRPCAPLAVVAALAMAGATPAAAAPKKVRVDFAKGTTSATVKGTVKGDGDIDYLVRAAAGQTLAVEMKGSNGQNYFNVLPPGSDGVAMHVAQDGKGWSGMLPADGDYKVRVYLMRAAARRKESSSFTLTVGVTGKALPPLPAAGDAKVKGTPYHATATVPCTQPYEPEVKSCNAGVVRRGRDATATFEAIGKTEVRRRILFEHGKPVASDSPTPLASTRRGDVTVVTFGVDESYEIPDAFLGGG